MVDSSMVLMGQTIAYTLYVLVIMALMGWFSVRVTKPSDQKDFKPALFYVFVAFLAVIGISLHIITYTTIPWAPLDLNRDTIRPDKTFHINIAAHSFQLPGEKLLIKCNEKVLFNVTSSDLTYGFGLFRKDLSMVFQMQVVPGHNNDLLWQFDRAGVYSIRSTEYSGPAGVGMILPDVVEVSCDSQITNASPIAISRLQP